MPTGVMCQNVQNRVIKPIKFNEEQVRSDNRILRRPQKVDPLS